MRGWPQIITNISLKQLEAIDSSMCRQKAAKFETKDGKMLLPANNENQGEMIFIYFII